MRGQTQATRLAGLASLLAVSLFWASAARAADSTPPQIQHTPIARAAPPSIKLTARILDESKVFPQLFFRSDGAAYEAPIDLKRVRGSKDLYEALLPVKPGALEYYIECFDEFGNGPAHDGTAAAPHKVEVEASPDARVGAGPTARDERLPLPDATPLEPPPLERAPDAAANAAQEPHRPLTTTLETTEGLSADEPLSQKQALYHSLLLPGWGQLRTGRRVRGAAFAAATGVALIASILLVARAKQANDLYEGAPPSVRAAAFNQANSYAHSRDVALGLTALLWTGNAFEAWFGYGKTDPW